MEEAAESIVKTAAESVVNAATESVVNGAAESVVEAVADSIVESAADTILESAAESVLEAATESAFETATQSILEAATESAFETATESILEAATDSAFETATQSILEAATDSAFETATESILEAATDSAFETATESILEAATESAFESATDSILEAATESAFETATESMLEAASDSVLEAATETVTEGIFEGVIEESAADVLTETMNNVAEAAADSQVVSPLNMLGIEPMNYRQIYQMVAGVTVPDTDYLEPYMATVVYLLIVITLGLILRKLTKLIMPASIQVYLVEFVATMEVCSYFFENNFVLKHYGYTIFFFVIVLEILISNRTLEGASENPIKALDEFTKREIGFDKALLKIVFQCCGGLAAYRLAQLVWSLDMIEDHHVRFYEVSCDTDLVTSIALGFLVEMGAAFIDTYLGKQSLSSTPFIDELIKAVNGGIMIVGGVSLTGMYFNPAMATGHMLGCKGTEMWEHLLVYWAGPFVGCLCGVILDRYIRIEKGMLV
ncbi:aquaporinaquaporin-11-like [Octopus vulgaris]|uniref:Aquaporinaquaporin-11-like n=1 Tax=Octopus vulgaris TaxID=6645 RepID=A0AA36FQC6_OCTVU|nr:aquaporinaquaporin-11-like [Octopus vulgaris]